MKRTRDSSDMDRTPSILDQISTRWSLISDPARFILRYARAIQAYLGAILRDPEAVAEVAQDLHVILMEKRFVPEQITRGRFRDYLKAVVRNAALSYLRRQQARPDVQFDALTELPGREDAPGGKGDQAFQSEWRNCLLSRVWDQLQAHERKNPAGRCHSVLQLVIAHGAECDMPELAAMLSAHTGEIVRADTFRKQLSRARRQFAKYLLREVARTLEQPSAESIEDELVELELLSRVLPLLPDDWRERRDWLED